MDLYTISTYSVIKMLYEEGYNGKKVSQLFRD